jgi:hypothetical protein
MPSVNFILHSSRVFKGWCSDFVGSGTQLYNCQNIFFVGQLLSIASPKNPLNDADFHRMAAMDCAPSAGRSAFLEFDSSTVDSLSFR